MLVSDGRPGLRVLPRRGPRRLAHRRLHDRRRRHLLRPAPQAGRPAAGRRRSHQGFVRPGRPSWRRAEGLGRQSAPARPERRCGWRRRRRPCPGRRR
ncbi:MAG: hypothetical protein MZV64_18190 [Ignavibacteriales bacterium]|nr:hypothetical protein [Ignavibacteriales bacterium]